MANSSHPLYKTWENMMTRCYNKNYPSYHRYGGRGIKVCERWHNFTNFKLDMPAKPSANHSLDRFPNNDGDYEINNIRWATKEQQLANKTYNKTRNLKGQFERQRS